ncbi:hypothetical protein BYT27DRAFT_7310713 [Phlegmacium glaucopus]|nr:hypothetical protein BYT27DRAFT_7310713 [Phlegmacium glaucopus]
MRRVRSKHPAPVAVPVDGTDSGQGSGPLSNAFIAEMEPHPMPGGSRRIEAPSNISRFERPFSPTGNSSDHSGTHGGQLLGLQMFCYKRGTWFSTSHSSSYSSQPTTPARSGHTQLSGAPISSPIASNPLLQHPPYARMHTPSPGRKTTSLRTQDANAAWAAAEGLLPISGAFRMPGYAPAHIVGGITYSVCSSHTEHPGPASPAFASQLSVEHPGSMQFVPNGLQRHPSERSQRESRIALANTSSQPRRLASGSHFHHPWDVPAIGEAHQARAPESHPHVGSSPAGIHPACWKWPQLDVNADLLAAISVALGSAILNITPNVGPSQPSRKFFSRTITNTTSELPISVIKELKNGFKAYILMSLCTHKACSNAMRSTDAFDTEIGMNERGEIRLKQKTFTAVKDHSITTNDFTEIRENFTQGMRKYLILGDDILPAGERALDCADMFQEFFSVIAARPDYTQDWPSYRGYIIESYTSWIGRRDDSFGLIFDEHLFHKYKMKNLIPSLLEQLRPSTAVSSTFGSHRMQGVAGSGGGSSF